ncbi:MAG: hypothetical protein ABFD86_16685 [Bryobacteraceae bacterium]
MRHGFTQLFLAWGGVLILIALVKLAQGKTLPDVAAIGCMGLIGLGLAAGTWTLLGRWQGTLKQEQPQAPATVEHAKPAVPPAGPIEMRQSKVSILTPAAYAVFFLFAAGWLVRYPDTLWTRWLAYPAALGLVAIAIGAVFVAVSRRNVVYVADAQGIETRDLTGSTRVAWKDVGAVKSVERRVRRYRSSLTNLVARYLLLEDRAGEELLRLEDVTPPEAYQRFLAAIPAWTGQPVRQETVTDGVHPLPKATTSSQEARKPDEMSQAIVALGSSALARQMATHLVNALMVWIGVVVLISLAGMILLHDTRYSFTTGLLRFGTLFWKCLLIVLAAELLLWFANFRWVGDEPGPIWFSKVVAIVFAAVPIAVGALGVYFLLNQEDPWAALPGGPPFPLQEFASRHPQLRIENVGILGGDTVTLTCGSSRRVFYSQGELRESDLNWEKCADANEPALLGGPPPFPNSRCLARIRMRRPDYDAVSEEDLDRGVAPPDIRTVRYVYSTGDAGITEVTEHFKNWAKSVGPEPNVYGYRRIWMEAESGGKAWTVEVRGAKNTVDDVYVDYTEKRTQPQTKDE